MRKNLLSLFIAALGLFGTGCAASAEPAPRQEAVRGVWLTNVASDALDSRENIREAVSLCSELGFNTIFTVTWNRAHTLYPSEVLNSVTGTRIDPRFEGRDPLQELIEEAHAKNIRVFAWFEFGFAASYGDSTGGPLIQNRPSWASLDQEGRITTKNNFQWMNAFHPEVQQFIRDLVMEVVNTYDVDGIQGDDRLPALPSNGGYDPFTVELYKSEHSGQEPPSNEKEYEWIKWRSDKLTAFLSELVQDIRQASPETIISMAPSIYPWAEENYLQDWPTWLDMGLVDLVIPQVYRYDADAYVREMDRILEKYLGNYDRKSFYPGVLLQVDTYNPDPELVREIIHYNRSHGIEGEIYFFYEGIKKFKPLFREEYAENPVDFPELIKIKE